MAQRPLSDDYFIRLERAATEIIAYRGLSRDAYDLASTLIHESRFARSIGLWIADEEKFAQARFLAPKVFRRAVRQLEGKGVLHRKKWVQTWWYEIRPHHEWKTGETAVERRSRHRALIEIFRFNPSPISCYQSFWPEVAGNQIANHSCPVRREERDLYVACDGEAVRATLQEEKTRRLITRRLRVKLREVSRIHFVLEPLPREP